MSDGGDQAGIVLILKNKKKIANSPRTLSEFHR